MSDAEGGPSSSSPDAIEPGTTGPANNKRKRAHLPTELAPEKLEAFKEAEKRKGVVSISCLVTFGDFYGQNKYRST